MALVRLSVHALPLVTALCLISINVCTSYPKEELPATALQFLAKGLELLTQASIANMALCFLRREVLDREALPFGAMFAGLQTSSISYLWSLEFIGSLTSTWFPSRRKWAFALFTTFNIVLAAGVGPSIAITLIPRSQLFPFGQTSLWFHGSEDDLFPSQLNKGHVPTSCYAKAWEEMTSDAYVECPWRALPTVLELVKNGATADLPSFKKMIMGGIIQTLQITNVMYDPAYGYTYFPIRDEEEQSPFVSFLKEQGHDGVQAVTATTKGLMQAFFTTWAQISFGPSSAMPEVFKVGGTSRVMKSHSKQALAWTQCREALDLSNVEFPGIPNSSLVRVPNLPPSSHWQLAWVDVTSELPVSIAAIVVPPVPSPNTTASNAATFCTISASWADSYLLISGIKPLKAESGVTALPNNAVRISSEWASLLISNWPSANDPNTTLLDIMLPPVLQEDQDVQGSIETLLSGLVVVAMTQTLTAPWRLVGNPYNFSAQLDLPLSNPEHQWIQNGTPSNAWAVPPTDAQGRYLLETELSAEGPAYTPRGIPTVIALVTLTVYCIYIVLSAVFILVIRPESSSSWDSISELTALAVLSVPTERLQNTSAGIKTLNVYREPVNVRAAAGDDHLEIVVQ